MACYYGAVYSNGVVVIATLDPEDPEYIRQMRRPAEIKEDVKQMESRKRVSLILNSPAFREELEHIVNEQLRVGPHPSSLLALQQISELVLPQSKISQGSLFSKRKQFSPPAWPRLLLSCPNKPLGSLLLALLQEMVI